MTPRESGRAMMLGTLYLIVATTFGVFIGLLITHFWK